ncbi:hypothetical protein PABG_12539 [Paracoccidioides brasiliensis Pb03]|nr:hypothetical protein PABG_12539 [Paracoccidioides brasiliensis Pb03]
MIFARALRAASGAIPVCAPPLFRARSPFGTKIVVLLGTSGAFVSDFDVVEEVRYHEAGEQDEIALTCSKGNTLLKGDCGILQLNRNQWRFLELGNDVAKVWLVHIGQNAALHKTRIRKNIRFKYIIASRESSQSRLLASHLGEILAFSGLFSSE